MSTQNSSLLSAIERAKQVAAKLSQQIPSAESGKRSADSDDESSSKKFASITDVVGAQLAALKAQTNTNSVVEEYKVPDKLVGLVIGKGGEQIQKLQADAGCKVVVQTESIGLPYRVCTLSGARDAVERAKRLIDDIIQRGATDSSMLPAGQEVYELRIPGNKCGLIIGKNGETIKRLAEQYGVKLVVVQESNAPSNGDKPLRITGETERVQRCKDAVMQLINPTKGGEPNKFSTNEYGSKNPQYQPNSNGQSESYIKVPSDKAGIVIGKGGETIKDINRRSGALCEIDKAYRNSDGPDKFFIVRGTYDQIIYCQQLIYEKITGNIGAQPPPGYFGPNALQPNSYSGSPVDTNSNQGYGAWGYPQSPSGNNTGGMDPMAAWAAYYQYYQQQSGAPQPQAASNASQTQPSSTGSQPAVNPQTGQPDYSLAWVEYYRSLGMYAEAEAILKQTQSNGSSSASTTSSSTSTTTTSTTTSSSTASSSSSNTQVTAAAAWQNYAYGGYPGYPGYSTSQTQ